MSLKTSCIQDCKENHIQEREFFEIDNYRVKYIYIYIDREIDTEEKYFFKRGIGD